MKKVLTVAGSDSSGGAGIQADLKTFQELGVYGMSAVTVIVSMDPFQSWNHRVFPVDVETIQAQLDTVIHGIGIEAMKTGMLPSAEVIELVAQTIRNAKVKNIVVDPVMVCKGAETPIQTATTQCYLKELIPLAEVVTPNNYEAAQLSGLATICTIDHMKEAARRIGALGASFVVVKGGKGIEHHNAADVLFDGADCELLESERIQTENVHGAGCTFSAAIAAGLAQGAGTREAVARAKDFVTEAIRHSFRLNQYIGPTDHSAYRKSL